MIYASSIRLRAIERRVDFPIRSTYSMQIVKLFFQRLIHEMGISIIFFTIISAILYAFAEGMVVLTPSIIVGSIEDNRQLGIILIYVFVLVVSTAMERLVRGFNRRKYMAYRLKEVANLNIKCLHLPVNVCDSKNGQLKLNKAQQAVSYGNEIGVEAYLQGILSLTGSVLSLLLFLILASKLPWWIILIIFGAPLVKIPMDNRRVKKEQQDLEQMSETWDADERLKRTCLEPRFGTEVRLFNLDQLMNSKMCENAEEVKQYNRRSENRKLLVMVSYRVWMMVVYLLIMWCFAYRPQLHVDLVNFVLYLGIMLQLSGQIDNCYHNISEIRMNHIHVKNFINFFEMPSYTDQTEEVVVSMPEAPYELTFEQVSFSYKNNEVYTLQDVSFTIHNGEKLAIVGRNGAGKSTLVKLICRLYNPSKGKILINGVDIATIDVVEYNHALSAIFQDSLVLASSVLQNVSCKRREESSAEQVMTALELAGLSEVVGKRATGLDTELTVWLHDEGISFSGGETQKLMLARALYKNSDLLILDEPTSALDPIAEAKLYEQYLELTKAKLSIFISHRLSSTQFCDTILFMQEGKVVQKGNHQQLLNEEGPYRTMYRVQSKYYEEEGSYE